MARAAQAQIQSILCSNCLQPTRHTLRDSYDTSWENEETNESGGSAHDFLVCNGCETPTLRTTSWYSEADPGDVAIRLFPPRGNQEAIRSPKSFQELGYGSPLESVYRQTIAAFNQKLLTLAGAGVRLIIEGVCNDRGIVGGDVMLNGALVRRTNLQGRINGLVEQGFVTEQQAEALHQIRFLGNDAAHELDQPTERNVSMALDIVEHLIDHVYEQPAMARALAARRRP